MAETYGWTPTETLEEIPWASIVMLLEARAQRLSEAQSQSEPRESGGGAIQEIAPGVYGVGLGR